jgi:hypothetical protein
MSIEAMRNAVEAMDKHDFEMADHILCQAIAEAEKQEQGEPVGEMVAWPNDFERVGVDWISYVPDVGTKLYTTPQQPVIDRSAAIRIATALGWTPPKQEQGEPVAITITGKLGNI